VSFLCCQLFNIFETSIIFFLKFRSGIELRSREKSIPSSFLLSPYLFIIGVELLSLQIKSNPKIKGALVNDTESLISQYADVNSALSHREDEYFHP
jgi:hypothetical protein